MEDLQSLIVKIEEVIRLDITNVRLKAVSNKMSPEDQDALIKYYKVLSDAKLQAKEKELDEKIARAEEIIQGRAVKAS